MNRTQVQLVCPGSLQNAVVLAATAGVAQYGIGHPAPISGSNAVAIVALDSNGAQIGPANPPLLYESGPPLAWYWPPSGANQIVAFGDPIAFGTATLEYDTPVG